MPSSVRQIGEQIMMETWVAGVDGCMGGWVAVFRPAGDAARAEVEVFQTFAEILQAPRDPRVVAVDMPIGLPEHTARSGRGPEAALRPQLGARQSSVFSIPSRKAVYAADYRTACAAARATSDPPRAVSKQAFMLFRKIREIDALLRSNRDIAARVFECHPEGSFRMLRGAPLQQPKKLKSRVHEPGLAERRQLLGAQAYATTLLEAPPPRGAGRDDVLDHDEFGSNRSKFIVIGFNNLERDLSEKPVATFSHPALDACAAAWTAARIMTGKAISWPAEPIADGFGLQMAIWT
jgi:predicted RNase H-like nuclease